MRQLEKHNQLTSRTQRNKILVPKSVTSYKFERTKMCTSEEPLFPRTHQTRETRGQVQTSLTLAWHLLVLYGCHTHSAWALADPLWTVCLNDPQPIYNSHTVAGCSHVPPRCQQHFHMQNLWCTISCILIPKIGRNNITFLMQALVLYSIIPH